jgi:hypothetical protein
MIKGVAVVRGRIGDASFKASMAVKRKVVSRRLAPTLLREIHPILCSRPGSLS